MCGRSGSADGRESARGAHACQSPVGLTGVPVLYPSFPLAVVPPSHPLVRISSMRFVSFLFLVLLCAGVGLDRLAVGAVPIAAAWGGGD